MSILRGKTGSSENSEALNLFKPKGLQVLLVMLVLVVVLVQALLAGRRTTRLTKVALGGQQYPKPLGGSRK